MTQEKGTPELLGRFPPTRRRYLSDDVQKRVAVTVTRSALDAPLPLAQPPAKPPEQARERHLAFAAPTLVQTQPEEENADETGNRPSPQQIADRVYQLMRQDLRLERERRGW